MLRLLVPVVLLTPIACLDKAGPVDTDGPEAPTISLLTPVEGESFTDGELITFSAQVSDDNQAPDELDIEWSSSLDGLLSKDSASADGLASFTTLTLSPGAHTVTLTAVDDEDLPSSALVSFTVGGRPSAPVVGIEPDPANTADSLVAVLIEPAEDPSGRELDYSYRWTVDGSPADGVSGDTVDSSLTERDQVWAVAVTASAAGVDGPEATAAITVGNAPPIVESVTLTPTTPEVDDTLICSAEGVSDADGDEITLSYTWTIDAEPIDADAATLEPGVVVKGDQVTCSVIPSDGQDEGEAVASEKITVDNGVPTVAEVSISPDPATIDDTLSCTWSGFYDPDGDPDLTTHEWYIDGVSAGSEATLSGPFRGGSTVWCVVTPDDGFTRGDDVTAERIISNTAPTVDGVAISPDPAYRGDRLSCEATGFQDAEGDPDSSRLSWTVDGVDAGSADQLAGDFLRGTEVACTFTPSDGLVDGIPETVETTIANSPPTLNLVMMSPEPAWAGDTLSCAPSGFSDNDGDPDQTQVSWLVNGVEVATGLSLSSGFGGGDTVECVATPHDGIEAGTAVSDSQIILNTAPEIDTIELRPNPAVAGDSLTCTWQGFNDPDGDADRSTVAWTLNGIDAGRDTTIEEDVVGGDLVACTVTPFDGTEIGSALTDSLIVSNSPPSIDSVLVDPSPAETGDTLTCSWEGFSDPDGDPDQSTVEWLVNSVSAGTGVRLLGGFEGGDTVECVVTPSDGSDSGTPVSYSVNIGNSPPRITGASISPDPAYDGDTLTCSWTGYSDPEGDPDQSLVAWTVDGEAAGNETTLSGVFEPGDRVGCNVTPYDGYETGSPIPASLTISNHLPVVSNVQISPAPAFVGDTLTCTYDFEDDDGHADHSSISWRRGSTLLGEGATLSSGFSSGDTLTCIVAPNDGYEGTTQVSTTIDISNQAPAAPEMRMEPLTTRPGEQDLRCVLDTPATDPDGDLLSYAVSWTLDGVAYSGAETNAISGDTVPAQDVMPGDTWTCTATASDGEEIGPHSDRIAPVILRSPQMAAGAAFTCGVDFFGAVSCWGDDGDGLVSDAPSGSYDQVSSGAWHACALDADGAIDCWGDDSSGQVGDAPGTTGFVAMSLGEDFACALDADGDASCWGADHSGSTTAPAGPFLQIGLGASHACAIDDALGLQCWGDDSVGQATPPAGSYRAIASGGSHACAISDSGAIACWGDDGDGQATAPGGSFYRIAAGEAFTCALADTGEVSCWGDDSDRVVRDAPSGVFATLTAGSRHACATDPAGVATCWGDDSDGQSDAPWTISPRVTAGADHACGIALDGSLSCWGDDTFGQATPPSGAFVEVAGGERHACAVADDETLSCWGDDSRGQATPPSGSYVSVSAGRRHSCAIDTSDALTCWGWDVTGQVSGATSSKVSAVGSGHSWSCALTTSGSLSCWGDDSYGQISDTPAGSFTALAVGARHGCALESDGSASCWGSDSAGQATAPSGSFVALSAGFDHSCGTATDGAVTCWGSNLGDQVSDAPQSGILSTRSGDSHSCGLAEYGWTTCWGDDRSGQVSGMP